jgi:glycosyltransferase involved in cell wall biosynthesis
MKILLISPTLKGIGGVAQHVRDLIKFLKENGHDVDVISSENTFTIPIKKLKNPSFMISSFLKTKFSKNYDIVHTQHPIGALAMKNVTGKKILTIHGVYSKQIGMLHGKSSSNISNLFEKNAFAWADAVTAGSRESYEYYSKLGSKVSFIPNAIDIDSLPSGIDTRYDKQIIFAGRLSKEKGILTILETVKNLPDDIHLLIAGTGPEEETVINSVKNNKNIHYLGYQPKEKIIPLIRGSKLLIQPSLAEGISATLLEAMACETPVIATNIGGNLELFTNDETGILIEPENPDELLKKITYLLNDQTKLEQLSKSAFEKVQKYDWSNVGKEYLNLYKKLLQSKL